MMRVKSKVWLEINGNLIFGSGKAMILKYIRQTGSINKAAKKLKMSYRHAWSYIKSAERRLNKPLIICSKGGKSGGGTSLTPYAEELLEKFDELEQKVKVFTDEAYKEIF